MNEAYLFRAAQNQQKSNPSQLANKIINPNHGPWRPLKFHFGSLGGQDELQDGFLSLQDAYSVSSVGFSSLQMQFESFSGASKPSKT